MAQIPEIPDVLIVGAGPAGCVLAERFSRYNNLKVMVIDKRDHVAGNCHDRRHSSGQLVHRYGPHYFRTNSKDLIDYLSKYTEWIPGNYKVKSEVAGKLYPFPINLDTLEQFFGKTLDPESAENLLREQRHSISDPKNSEEFVLSRVGPRLFEAFYKDYTEKQWGRSAKDLAPSVCGRIPIRLNRENSYVDHRFQVTPKEGFTAMFAKMLNHPQIDVALNTDYETLRKNIRPKLLTIYTGPIDEYFDHKLGRLPYRSLRFEFNEIQKEFVQDCVQINYPGKEAFTRKVEIKHITGDKTKSTVIATEYPESEGDPFYPIPAPENQKLYEAYLNLAEQETQINSVYFVGRLARYRYFNTDEVIESALELHSQICSHWEKQKNVSTG